jgi:hypothetical protein
MLRGRKVRRARRELRTDQYFLKPPLPRRGVEIIHGEPMAVARLPADPLVSAIKQRLASLEGDMALVHETIAAIGDAARVSLLEDAGDDPGDDQEQQPRRDVSRQEFKKVR